MGSNLPSDDDHFLSSLDAGYMCLVAKQLISGQCDMRGGDVCSLCIMIFKEKGLAFISHFTSSFWTGLQVMWSCISGTVRTKATSHIKRVDLKLPGDVDGGFPCQPWMA